MRFLDDYINNELVMLENSSMTRSLKPIVHNGKYIITKEGRKVLNLSSNDYLGLLDNKDLKNEFLSNNPSHTLFFGSGSSRLLTGDCTQAQNFEKKGEELFNKPILLFNSGYHANTGMISALGSIPNTIIIADKLVHASIIDGIKLSGAPFERYRHNDLEHLKKIIIKHKSYKNIIIISEAVFSMDGNFANIQGLVDLKKEFPNIVLYIDEAHSFGLYGNYGLGLCEYTNNIKNIDIIVAPLGKAAASVGAFGVMNSNIKSYFINKCRSIIFSTSLPQINYAWNNFILNKIPYLQKERAYLQNLIREFKLLLPNCSLENNNKQILASPIIPYLCGTAENALKISEHLYNNNILAYGIRPPTVPPNGSRIRFSLTASMTLEEIKKIIVLKQQS